ncbi:hypothetical protein RRG08_066592 [Elysia crispata]|nr:hypothetical protein RRG08_066592 [Elysia crispata]
MQSWRSWRIINLSGFTGPARGRVIVPFHMYSGRRTTSVRCGACCESPEKLHFPENGLISLHRDVTEEQCWLFSSKIKVA